MFRNESAGIPLILTNVDKNKVKKVKLKINPVITPNGLFLLIFPDSTVEDKIIGKTGKIHGDKIVTTPAKKAKNKVKIITSN